MFKRIDWSEVFIGGIVALCGAMLIFLLLVIIGDGYYRVTSDTVCSEMELTVSALDKKTTSSVKLIGKVMMTQTDTDYFVYCGDIEIEVSYNVYNSLSISDNVVVVKKDWIREGEVWDTDYYLKGE
jgi:hypothetical protein